MGLEISLGTVIYRGWYDIPDYWGRERYHKSEDFAAVKAAFHDRHCIWRAVNTPVTVGRGSDEEIDEAVRFAIDTLGPRGFVLNASVYLYDDDVRWDRFMVFVDAWRRHA